jgi:hypothetical protein
MSAGAAPESEPVAWATVEIPAPPGEVLAYAGDLATVVRLNPYLDIRAWEGPAGPVTQGKRYRLHALNEWTGIERDLTLVVEQADGSGYHIAYSEGLKHALELRITPHDGGAALTLREHYRDPGDADRDAVHKEIDRSITPWAMAVRRDFLRSRRWGRNPLFRWLRRYWLGMRPRERRVARLVVWVTVLEFVVFLFVFAIYWNEAMR